MIIEIKDSLSIAEISDAFTAAFPFLSIQFFTAPHGWAAPSSMEHRIEEDKTIGEARTVHKAAAMEIHAWYKTGEVEQEFGKIFGLYIQVYRREGAAWVQTADTDPRTLQEQNEAARNAGQELLDGIDDRFNDENPADHE